MKKEKLMSIKPCFSICFEITVFSCTITFAFSEDTCTCIVVLVLKDHSNERPPVLKDHLLMTLTSVLFYI